MVNFNEFIWLKFLKESNRVASLVSDNRLAGSLKTALAEKLDDNITIVPLLVILDGKIP